MRRMVSHAYFPMNRGTCQGWKREESREGSYLGMEEEGPSFVLWKGGSAGRSCLADIALAKAYQERQRYGDRIVEVVPVTTE